MIPTTKIVIRVKITVNKIMPEINEQFWKRDCQNILPVV